jgi:hypothetical protein
LSASRVDRGDAMSSMPAVGDVSPSPEADMGVVINPGTGGRLVALYACR